MQSWFFVQLAWEHVCVLVLQVPFFPQSEFCVQPQTWLALQLPLLHV
jgi:hypothetical protein